MKKINASIVGVLLLLVSVKGRGQKKSALLPSIVEPYRLEVGMVKTTSLVFPGLIKNVDRGSKDLLVQKAKGMENVLQVKAATDSLEETSLTVITSDGNYTRLS